MLIIKRKHKKHSELWYKTHPNPKSTPKEIHGHHGHQPSGPSILWPALFDHLKAKGYSKEKAARISNAAWHKKKRGQKTNAPTSARGIAKADRVQEMRKRFFSAEQREKDAKSHKAMPHGGFPIETKKDLLNAIRTVGRAKDPAAAKAHIKRRARALGLTDLLPDGW
jgi:hypothetical protein